MKSLLLQIWHDERGFVNSAELILIATLAIIGVIVGIATFRDGLNQELADTGAAVGQINQSYDVQLNASVNQNPNVGPVVTVVGQQVTVSRVFNNTVSVETSFNNFEYNDETDLGDGQDTANLPPPGITSISAPIEEGQTP